MPTLSLAFGKDFVVTPLYDDLDPAFAGLQNPFAVKIRSSSLVPAESNHKKLPMKIFKGSTAGNDAIYCVVDNKNIYLLYTADMSTPYNPYGNDVSGNPTPYLGLHRPCRMLTNIKIATMAMDMPTMNTTVVTGTSRYKYDPTFENSLPDANFEFSLSLPPSPEVGAALPSTCVGIYFATRKTKLTYRLSYSNPEMSDRVLSLMEAGELVREIPAAAGSYPITTSVVKKTLGIDSRSSLEIGASDVNYADFGVLYQRPGVPRIISILTTRTVGTEQWPDAMIITSRMGAWIVKSNGLRVDLVGWNDTLTAGNQQYELLNPNKLVDYDVAGTKRYSALTSTVIYDRLERVTVPVYSEAPVSISILYDQLKIIDDKVSADVTSLSQAKEDLQAFTDTSMYDVDSKNLLKVIISIAGKTVTTIKDATTDQVPKSQITIAIVASVVITGGAFWLLLGRR